MNMQWHTGTAMWLCFLALEVATRCSVSAMAGACPHLFLTALSVRPGRPLAITDHLLPCCA